jgi:formamidopyrimidine-DNA glycosylase
MPELPEVETIRRELIPALVGKTIEDVKILRPQIVGYPTVEALIKGVKGCRIEGIKRQGKYLIIELIGSHRLIFHLRLSGKVLIRRNNEPPSPYERVRFGLSGGDLLSFVEPRALGRVYYLKSGERPAELKGFFKLGLEPLDPRFDKNYLKLRLAGRRARIKSLLLDQGIAAGVGNIYSDEALFLARVHPLRRAHTLSDAELGRIAKGLKQVLKEGLKAQGATFTDYRRPDGSPGRYQDQAWVFGREGKPCRRCKSKIEIARLGNRRTRYCPKCQLLINFQ